MGAIRGGDALQMSARWGAMRPFRSGRQARRSRVLLLTTLSLFLALLTLPSFVAARPSAPIPADFFVTTSLGGFVLPNGSFRQYDAISLGCSAAGAAGPITWQWSFGDGTNATETVNTVWATENHSYAAVGLYEITCRGVDSLGAHGSANLTVRVTSWPLVIVDLLIQPAPSVLQGYIATLQAQTSWGYGPDTYTWAGLPPGCEPGPPPESSFITCAPTAGGTYNVSVAVTDPVTNHTARSHSTLVVIPAFLGMPEGPGIEVVALVVLLAIVSEILVRFTRIVSKPSDPRRFNIGWALAFAGGTLGLASFVLPWLFFQSSAGPGGPLTVTFRPVDIFANAPTAGVDPQFETARPSYPNFIWSVIAPQIVGYLIFAAGALLALLRRMQGGFVMVLGLVVAALAIPLDFAGFLELGTGWYVGLAAAFVAAAGFYAWRPPIGVWPPITPVPRRTAPPAAPPGVMQDPSGPERPPEPPIGP